MANNFRYQLIPLDAIFAKLVRDLGLQTVDESDIIEWAGEALQAIGSVPMYEDAVAFIEVANHQCEIPNGCLIVDQLARNVCWKGPSEDALCPAQVLQDIKDYQDVSCSDANNPCKNTLPIPLDCNGSPLMDYNIAYYRPYYDLQAEYYGWNWNNSNMYRQCFRNVRLTTNSFFLTQDRVEQDFGINNQTPYQNCRQDEYKIIKGQTIRLSFKEGQIALAYKRQCIDATTGYPLIPDTFSHKTAIAKYIAMMMAGRDMNKKREGSFGLYDRLEKDWHWYCKQATNVDLMPHGIDEYQNLYDQRTRLLPANQMYYGFFGKMNVPEGRKFDDPDFRNYSVNFFRGSRGSLGY